MQAQKEIQKYQKGADLLIWRIPFRDWLGRLCKEKDGTKVTKLSGFGTTRSGGGIFGRAP